MRDKFVFSDAQEYTNEDSTGTISTNIFDMEQDGSSNTILTDDQIEAYLNVVVTAYSYTSGGTEGIVVELRTDDATDLATAKDGSSAGYIVIAAKEVPLEDLAAGLKISVPVRKDVLKRYVGAWLRAGSTTLTGTVTVDAYIDMAPISENESLQKVPS
jgi:hypothetical protein